MLSELGAAFWGPLPSGCPFLNVPFWVSPSGCPFWVSPSGCPLAGGPCPCSEPQPPASQQARCENFPCFSRKLILCPFSWSRPLARDGNPQARSQVVKLPRQQRGDSSITSEKQTLSKKMITFVLPGVQTSPLLCSARYKNSLKKPWEHGQAPSAFVN